MSFKPTRVDAMQMDAIPTQPFGAGDAGIWIKTADGALYFHSSIGVDHNISAGGGGGTIGVNGAYDNAVTAADNIVGLVSENGPVLIRDNATPIGGALFGVQDTSGVTSYLGVKALGPYLSGDFNFKEATNLSTYPRLQLENTTAATGLFQSQESPPLILTGRGWNGTSQAVSAFIYADPAQGDGANVGMLLQFAHSPSDLDGATPLLTMHMNRALAGLVELYATNNAGYLGVSAHPWVATYSNSIYANALNRNTAGAMLLGNDSNTTSIKVGSASTTGTRIFGGSSNTVGHLVPNSADSTFALLSDVPATTSIVTKTANYTITLSDYAVLGNATGGVFSVSLPVVATATGRIFVIKKIDSSANVVTVQANGAEIIDNSNTFSLTDQFDSITVQSDGTQWWIE